MDEKAVEGKAKGPISDKSRAFIMQHYRDKYDSHTFSDREKRPQLLWEARCKKCGRTLFITQSGDALGSATKNECL